MQFLLYLILGGVVYVAGFQLFLHKIRKQKGDKPLKPFDKRLMPYLMACFVVMLPVSWAVSVFILKHTSLQADYIIINSLVATVVFYFGLNPDETRLNLPD